MHGYDWYFGLNRSCSRYPVQHHPGRSTPNRIICSPTAQTQTVFRQLCLWMLTSLEEIPPGMLRR